MELKEKTLLWLDIFEFLTLNKKYKVLELIKEDGDIFKDFNKICNNLLEEKVLSFEQIENMKNMLNVKYVDDYVDTLRKNNIVAITYYSDLYPKQFYDYNNPPLVLYLKGDVSLLKSKCVAIIGTRRITRYGQKITEKYAETLSQNGVTIVSGMAEGVDTVAHKTALKNGGKTIAVLGSGFNDIYPHSNLELSKIIEQKGLLVSEYSPTTKAATFHFPIRNRIIVGLSDAVVITEAGLKSGVMYSRNYCLDYGKDLFVVPGNIDNMYSEGCNAILKSMQGAITTTPNDILDSLGISNTIIKQQKQTHQYSIEEKLILNTILTDEVHFDEILNKTKLDTKTLLRLLTTMELNGIIKKLAGNYYCKNSED